MQAAPAICGVSQAVPTPEAELLMLCWGSSQEWTAGTRMPGGSLTPTRTIFKNKKHQEAKNKPNVTDSTPGMK